MNTQTQTQSRGILEPYLKVKIMTEANEVKLTERFDAWSACPRYLAKTVSVEFCPTLQKFVLTATYTEDFGFPVPAE